MNNAFFEILNFYDSVYRYSIIIFKIILSYTINLELILTEVWEITDARYL